MALAGPSSFNTSYNPNSAAPNTNLAPNSGGRGVLAGNLTGSSTSQVDPTNQKNVSTSQTTAPTSNTYNPNYVGGSTAAQQAGSPALSLSNYANWTPAQQQAYGNGTLNLQTGQINGASNTTSTGWSSGNAPQIQVDTTGVPFGTSTTNPTTLSSLQAYTNYQNSNPYLSSPSYQQTQNVVAAAGDPMYGQTVPGTSLAWNDLTNSQKIAYTYATNYGTGGMSMTDFLNANAGDPNAAGNQSYSKMGINPSQFSNVTSAGAYAPTIQASTNAQMGKPQGTITPTGPSVTSTGQPIGLSQTNNSPATYNGMNSSQFQSYVQNLLNQYFNPQESVQKTPLGYTQYAPSTSSTSSDNAIMSLIMALLSGQYSNATQGAPGSVL